jgi:hypothetical protein
LRGAHPRGVGHRVACLDNFNPVAGNGMTVAGEDQTFERTRPQSLESARHRRRSLAGTHQHRTPAHRCRHAVLDCAMGVGRDESSVEHGAQYLARCRSIANARIAVPWCQTRRHFIQTRRHFISGGAETPALDPLCRADRACRNETAERGRLS